MNRPGCRDNFGCRAARPATSAPSAMKRLSTVVSRVPVTARVYTEGCLLSRRI